MGSFIMFRDLTVQLEAFGLFARPSFPARLFLSSFRSEVFSMESSATEVGYLLYLEEEKNGLSF